MSPAVLSVLKIIGIVILVILAVALVLVLLLLFFPVTHRLRAVRTGEEGDPPVDATFRLSWLFGFIRANGHWDGELTIVAKVLFFTVYKKPGDEKDTEEADPDAGGSDVDKDDGEETDGEASDDAEDVGHIFWGEEKEDGEAPGDTGEVVVFEQEKDDETAIYEPESVESGGSEDPFSDDDYSYDDISGEKKSFLRYLRDLPDILERVFCTLKTACDNIIKVPEYIEYYLMLIQAERTHRAWDKAVRRSMRILRELLPRRWNMDLTYGGGNPDSTGMVVEYVSMLYPITAGHLKAEWDYENSICAFDLTAKGHIILFVLLINGFRLYKDKDINITWKRLRPWVKDEEKARPGQETSDE